jgi:outer membrane protein assembly factor BamB
MQPPPKCIILAAMLVVGGGDTIASGSASRGFAWLPPEPGPPAAVTLAPLWEVPVPDTPAPYLLGLDDSFVVATPSGRVSLFGIDGGPPRWQIELGAKITASPVKDGGALVVPIAGGGIVLIDASSGQVTGRIPAATTPGVEAAPPDSGPPILSAVPAGVVIAHPTGSIRLLSAERKAVLWEARVEGAPLVPAAQCGEILLIGTAAGNLIALAAGDGRTVWRRAFGAAITTQPACEGNRAWVGSADNELHALKLKRKRCGIRWSYRTGGDLAGRPVLFDGTLLFLSYDTYLYAVEAGNGHLAWKVRLGRRPRAGVVLMGDLLVLAPLNAERLEVFHLPGGTQAGGPSLPTGADRFVTAPALAGRVIVIAAARYGEETARVIGLGAVASEKSPPASPAPSPR